MAVNRERRQIPRQVTELDLEFCTLRQAVQELQRLLTHYGPEAMIRLGRDGDYLLIEVRVDETDEQMAQRIAREERIEKRMLDRDREEFERLKAKFEGNG